MTTTTDGIPAFDAEIAVGLIREFSQIESRRANFERQWEDVAQVVIPNYSTSFYSQGDVTPGAVRTYRQYDNTANGALYKFGAAMESMITPRTSKWHRIAPANRDLLKTRKVALWFDRLNDKLWQYRYAPRANFAGNQHQSYIQIGAFGTTSLFVDKLDGGGLRYRCVHLGELFFAENHQGIVDKVFRRFKMTNRQAAQKWGFDSLPEKLRNGAKDRPEEESTYIHVVCPRGDEYIAGHLTAKGKKYASYYIHKDTQFPLSEGGYNTMPFNVTRYMQAPGELFGRGPAMDVLATVKTLNEMKKTMLKQGQRAVDPVLLAHDDGVLDGFNLKSGAINMGAVNAQGQKLVHTLDVGNLALGKEQMDDERATINDAFLVTLFQILVDTPQMTATEVLERAREKGALLSPTMGRFQSEGIGPMIEREVDLLMMQGLIEPPPHELIEAGGEWMPEYDSPLTRAMRSEEAVGAMRTVQWAGEIAAQTQDPTVMDAFDFDTMIPELADINGVPFSWLASPEMVAQKRKGRQQAAAQQNMVQALPGIAALQKASTPQGNSLAPGQPGGGS
jgi:hypothetical protein